MDDGALWRAELSRKVHSVPLALRCHVHRPLHRNFPELGNMMIIDGLLSIRHTRHCKAFIAEISMYAQI